MVNGSPAAALGLDRTCWVRLLRDRDGLHAELAGVSRRRPVVRRIPTSVAARLIAEGVPVVVHRLPADEALSA